MFGTEDEYTKAIRGATIHAHEEENEYMSIFKNIVMLGLVVATGYFGFNYYSTSTLTVNPEKSVLAQVTKKQVPVAVPEKAPTAVMGVSHTRVVEDQYLVALSNMEVDVLGDEPKKKEEKIELDTSIQENLSAAMSSIIDDAMAVDNSSYTKEITKEIKGDAPNKNRVVVVKQGDTLAAISERYYGDAMKYNKIIASNSGSINNDSRIYVGQKIKLPY